MESTRRYSAQPSDSPEDDDSGDNDSNRSTPDHDPTQGGYYSEDFEQEDDDDYFDVNQEVDGPPLPPPYQSPRSGRHGAASTAPSEDAIRVYKSTTGPRLTIQPKKSITATNSRTGMQVSRISGSEINVRGNAFQRGEQNPTKKPIPSVSNSTQFQRKLVGGGGVILVKANNKKPLSNVPSKQQQQLAKVKTPKSRGSVIMGPSLSRKPSRGISSRELAQIREGGGDGDDDNDQQLVQASASGSSFRQRLNSRNGNKKIPASRNPSHRSVANPYHQALRYVGPQNTKIITATASGAVAQRVASAKRSAMNDLRNRISMLSKEAEELRRENRVLKVCQNRQNMALKKYEGRDAQLPKIISQHAEEMRSIHAQLKKALQTSREVEEKSRFKDRKITKLEIDLASLNKLATKDNLKERNALQEQVNILSANIAGCEKKIRQYMRHVEILENNHKHQITAEKQKLIKANHHAMELRHEITGLKVALRDKDRLLNYIQMRSSGRNMIKSFQTKERQHNEKLNPAMLCPGGSYSPRSRSISPHRNQISGRTYRAQSLDRPEDFTPESEILIEQLKRESCQNSPRLGEIQQQIVEEESVVQIHNDQDQQMTMSSSAAAEPQPIINVEIQVMDKGDHHHQQHQQLHDLHDPHQNDHDPVTKQNDGEYTAIGRGGDGDGVTNFQNHHHQTQSMTALVSELLDPTNYVPGPMKNEYYKMSKILEANYPRVQVNKLPVIVAAKASNKAVNPPPVSHPAHHSTTIEEKTQTDPIPYLGQISQSATPWAQTKLVDKLQPPQKLYKPHQQKPPTYMSKQSTKNFAPSTGPKTHSVAKQEMKLQRELLESSRPKPNHTDMMMEDDYKQRKKWEKVVVHQQGPTRPQPLQRKEPMAPTMMRPDEDHHLSSMSNRNMSNYSSSVQVYHGPTQQRPRQDVVQLQMAPTQTTQFEDVPLSSTANNYTNIQYINPSPRPTMEMSTTKMTTDYPPLLPMSSRSNYSTVVQFNNSPRSQDQQHHHQFQEYVAAQPLQTLLTSPRVICSTPQMQQYSGGVQVREIYSIPIVGQHGIPNNHQPTENSPQKCIFSYSNSVPNIIPTPRNQNLNQPMNLPFFSSGDGPQQQETKEKNQRVPTDNFQKSLPPPPIQRSTNQKSVAGYQPKPINRQRSSINQKINKPASSQASHIYNPSFFSQLGTWK